MTVPFIVLTTIIVLAAAIYLLIVHKPSPTFQKKPYKRPKGYGNGDFEFAEELASILMDKKRKSSTYLKSNIVLLIKDPYWLYTFWEISPSDQESFDKIKKEHLDFSISDLILRIYNISQGSINAPYFDLLVENNLSDYYIRVNPGNKYFVEIGYQVEGIFFALARSNQVTTPACSISANIDPNWVPDKAVWQSIQETINLQVPGSEYMQTISSAKLTP
ncbi:DUF4912 domain-containing protein [Bacillota bacterium LX-D]|nr:DUF4912 domain-containing protein [Bacillota bacterium LX-D]